MDRAAGASTVLERSRVLTAVLQALADAMASGDAATVLDCEASLRAAVAPRGSDVQARLDPEARAALGDDIARCRAALVRCRALGATHRHVTDATLAALGRHGGYGPHGAVTSPRPTRGTDVRVRG